MDAIISFATCRNGFRISYWNHRPLKKNILPYENFSDRNGLIIMLYTTESKTLKPSHELFFNTASRQLSIYVEKEINETTLHQLLAGHLQSLISHGACTNDETLSLYLSCLCYDWLNFSSNLTDCGWGRANNYFIHSNTRGFSCTITQPRLPGEALILIPFFVRSNHWMAVARVIFLYSDDLIQPVIEHQIWNSLHYMDVHFYPPHSEWIHCHCTIYSPHYNECGPRTLLALTIMALDS